MSDLTDFEREYALELLGQVLDGKRPGMEMDTIFRLKVAAIVRLGDRILKLEIHNA